MIPRVLVHLAGGLLALEAAAALLLAFSGRMAHWGPGLVAGVMTLNALLILAVLAAVVRSRRRPAPDDSA